MDTNFEDTTMKIFTVVARVLVTSLLIVYVDSCAAQQTYPIRPMHIIVLFPPGGSNDIIARLIGPKLTEAWGQPVIVDNRPGGNGVIGTMELVKAPPDGHTMLVASSGLVIAPMLARVPYDVIKDFTPVATICLTENVVVTSPAVPANNLREFIALAKANPGKLNFGSSGTGSSLHLAAELVVQTAGIKMQHIPYKGAMPVITDLMGGQVQMFVSPPIVVLPYINSGKLKALAVSGKARNAALPQVPTFAEAGLPGLRIGGWQGFFVPSATPKVIVDKLAAEMGRIVALPDINKILVSQGYLPLVSTPEQFAGMMKEDMVKYADIIKTANIKLEE